MAELLPLPVFNDSRGSLNVIEASKTVNFEIKRMYSIYNVPGDVERGGHRHRTTTQALICVKGDCKIFVDNGSEKNEYILDSPDKCLIVKPEDWHTMHSFSDDAVLIVLSSTHYDKNDYIDEKYN